MSRGSAGASYDDGMIRRMVCDEYPKPKRKSQPAKQGAVAWMGRSTLRFPTSEGSHWNNELTHTM